MHAHPQGEILTKTECKRTVNCMALQWVHMRNMEGRVIFPFSHAEKLVVSRPVTSYLIRTDGKVTKLTSLS